MTQEGLCDLAPLAALECRRQLQAFERVVGLIALGERAVVHAVARLIVS